jgi:hypothetical protein
MFLALSFFSSEKNCGNAAKLRSEKDRVFASKTEYLKAILLNQGGLKYLERHL